MNALAAAHSCTVLPGDLTGRDHVCSPCSLTMSALPLSPFPPHWPAFRFSKISIPDSYPQAFAHAIPSAWSAFCLSSKLLSVLQVSG